MLPFARLSNLSVLTDKTLPAPRKSHRRGGPRIYELVPDDRSIAAYLDFPSSAYFAIRHVETIVGLTIIIGQNGRGLRRALSASIAVVETSARCAYIFQSSPPSQDLLASHR